MSEAEFIEVMIATQAEAGRSFMDFVTVLFGYLVGVHFLGNRIPLALAIFVSVIYSCFMIFPAFGVTNMMVTATNVANAYPELARLLGGGGVSAGYFPVVVITSGWAISIWYMVHVRRAGTT
jgi:hypothetical protein